MPLGLKSILSQALKAIADKGENVPIDLVKKRLAARGVRADEMEGAELDYMLDNQQDTFPNDTVYTRSGNVALTPEGIRKLDVDRFDRDAVDTGFKTKEDTQAQHEIKAQEGMEDVREGPTVTNPDVLRERVEDAEDLILHLQAERARLPEGDGNVWAIDEEIADLQADIIRYNTEAANILPEDIVRSMDAEQYARDTSPLRDIYEGITPEDVDLDTYGIAIFKDPRDVRQPGSKVSSHFGYLDEADYSYHMRYDIEPDSNAFRVFEMQSDLVPAGGGVRFEEWKKHSEFQRKTYLSKKSDTKLRNLQDQLEDIEIEIKESAKKEEELYARTGRNLNLEARRRLQEQRAELTYSADNLLRSQQSISLPDISETKNMINRALVMGENKGTQEVKFLINPEEEVWSGRMARTEEVQKHYETVVAGQIRSVAKKIGASVRSDKAGYLIVGLPAAGFTLPLYAEENKEASYLATADLRGEDTEEAKAYLDHKKTHSFVFPFPDKEEETPLEPTTNFNTGGKVLRSLQRTRSAKGGIFGMFDRALNKGAKFLGFDDDRQVQITADAVDLTNKIVPPHQRVGVKRVVPEPDVILQGPPEKDNLPTKKVAREYEMTTDDLRNADTNRNQFKIDGDEEVFDVVNHALFGYESAENPLTAAAGQAKEVYQGAKQAIKGQEWRTELKDMWNNSWGINQRKQGFSRPEFDNALAQAIANTQDKLKRGEPLRMGEDIIINALDLAQKR